MRQGTFSEAGFEKYQKKTRREKFLEEMEGVVPWGKLVDVIEPYYPKPEGVRWSRRIGQVAKVYSTD